MDSYHTFQLLKLNYILMDLNLWDLFLNKRQRAQAFRDGLI